MKESEAKKKRCPHMMVSAATNLSAALQIVNNDPDAAEVVIDATDKSGAFNCQAHDCMLWEADMKASDKEVYINDPTPEGWHDIAGKASSSDRRTIRQYVEIDSGDCGLKTKYLECNGS